MASVLLFTALANILRAQTPSPLKKIKVDCIEAVRVTNDVSRLEELLLQCPKQKKDIAAKIIALQKQAMDTLLQLEAKEVELLKADGVNDRFAIPISADKPSLYETEPGAITLGYDGNGLVFSEGVIGFGPSGLILPTLTESIYRFDGQVDLKLLPLGITGFVVTSQDVSPNRLTFIIFDGKFVYLRGRGKVQGGDGKEIVLGMR